MKETLMSAASTVINNKVAGGVTAASSFWLSLADKIDPAIRTASLVAALILSIVMIRAHWNAGTRSALETELLRNGHIQGRRHDDEANG